MKEILGYFLIAQAVLTGIIVYAMTQLADSIKASAAYITTKEGSLSWGNDLGMPTFAFVLLIAVIGKGIYLVLQKK
ncbi:hypothetical protein IHV12_17925 [Fictibacillus sp. 7GRE50]|uniref:hypothetical protein n=1 Tax=unclassified Fictibacillus TaxID=2644029 RepID=UPI0018CEC029|nr:MULTISPECIES: hypothetical protein [unclassified Fictibacillus]MBH0166800.1 hypothetical protein [Fictibacillus sp. 7GRE50]MBH0174217.1 hypothetical protein [Fictibacillus sp. 23RED33]